MSRTIYAGSDHIYTTYVRTLFSLEWMIVNLCPVAEKVQAKMMQFKTNYRNMDEAKINADITRKNIKDVEE